MAPTTVATTPTSARRRRAMRARGRRVIAASPRCSTRDSSSRDAAARLLAQVAARSARRSGRTRRCRRPRTSRGCGRSIVDDALQPPGRYVMTSTRSESCTASVRLCVMSSVVCCSCLLDLQHLVAEQQARLLVERGERLVHQQDPRLGGERARDRDALPHAAGQLGGIAALEPVEADQRDEMRARARSRSRLRHSRRSRAGTRRCRSPCARETSTLPGTPCRSPDACPTPSLPSTVTRPS